MAGGRITGDGLTGCHWACSLRHLRKVWMGIRYRHTGHHLSLPRVLMSILVNVPRQLSVGLCLVQRGGADSLLTLAGDLPIRWSNYRGVALFVTVDHELSMGREWLLCNHNPSRGLCCGNTGDAETQASSRDGERHRTCRHTQGRGKLVFFCVKQPRESKGGECNAAICYGQACVVAGVTGGRPVQ